MFVCMYVLLGLRGVSAGYVCMEVGMYMYVYMYYVLYVFMYVCMNVCMWQDHLDLLTGLTRMHK